MSQGDSEIPSQSSVRPIYVDTDVRLDPSDMTLGSLVVDIQPASTGDSGDSGEDGGASFVPLFKCLYLGCTVIY